jgi:hypothetical protein
VNPTTDEKSDSLLADNEGMGTDQTFYEPVHADVPGSNTLDRSRLMERLSWISFALAGLTLLVFALYMPGVQSRFLSLWPGKQPHGMGGLIFLIPPWLFAFIPAGLGTAAVSLQLRHPDKALCAITHLTLVIAAMATFILHVIASASAVLHMLR